MVDPEQSPGHWLRHGSQVGLTRVSIRIKMIIIIILKLNSRINPRQG